MVHYHCARIYCNSGWQPNMPAEKYPNWSLSLNHHNLNQQPFASRARVFFLSLYVPFCTMTIISCNLLHVCIMRLKGYYSNWCDQKKIQVTLYVFNWLSLNYLVLSLHATDRLNLELAQKDEKLNIEHLNSIYQAPMSWEPKAQERFSDLPLSDVCL